MPSDARTRPPHTLPDDTAMATTTKKELIDRISSATGEKRIAVKNTVQLFLNQIIIELGKGNRLEFRDFGVFEVKLRRARRAQNPKTLEPVQVAAKRTVKFKPGRLMKQTLEDAGLGSEEFEFELPDSVDDAPELDAAVAPDDAPHFEAEALDPKLAGKGGALHPASSAKDASAGG